MLQTNLIKSEKVRLAKKDNNSLLLKFGVIFGITGGLTALLTAIILIFAAGVSNDRKAFDTKEVWLILLSFALLTAGAHCLDKLEKVNKTSNKK